jgi:hypothetical protein
VQSTGAPAPSVRIDADRVRESTSPSVQQDLDRDLVEAVRRHAARALETRDVSALTDRIAELDEEWDVERLLEANASTLALAGTVLGATRHRRWLWLPGLVTVFLLQHALQGWCPPIVLFRRMGVRTRKEIDVERSALKVLRGDFDSHVESETDALHLARRAVEAATR